MNDANEIGSPGTIDNDPPTAGADAVTTAEDTPATFNVLANDADADGDALTIVSYTAVAHGVLVSNGAGSFTYTPAADFNGTDAFSYTITDGKGRTATAAVAITVSAVNDAPVVTVPGAQSTPEDAAVNVGGISVADVDAGEGTGLVQVTLSAGSGKLTASTGAAGGLTAAQISGNGTGSVVLGGTLAAVNATLGSGVTYLGNLNFNGADVLTVVADDLGNTGAGGALADTKVISIKVLSPTEQIAGLRGMVGTLSGQGALSRGQATSLVKKLDTAQAALDQGKPKGAFTAIGAFKNEVQSLVATAVLTSDQAAPLLAAAELLSQSLRTGGGF